VFEGKNRGTEGRSILHTASGLALPTRTGAKLQVHVEKLGQAGHLKRRQVYAVLELQPLQVSAGKLQVAQVGAVGQQQLFKPQRKRRRH